jgi:hypothetical protein
MRVLPNPDRTWPPRHAHTPPLTLMAWPPWTFSLALGIEEDQSRTFIPNFRTKIESYLNLNHNRIWSSPLYKPLLMLPAPLEYKNLSQRFLQAVVTTVPKRRRRSSTAKPRCTVEVPRCRPIPRLGRKPDKASHHQCQARRRRRHRRDPTVTLRVTKILIKLLKM